MIRRRKTRHGHPQPRRRNLRHIKIIASQKSNRDEKVKEEDEEDARNLRALVARRHAIRDGQRDHTEGHAAAGNNKEFPSAEAVDGEEGHEGR